jgi:hypothetical protein
MHRIWIVGSGSLAQAVCHSLSVIVTEPMSVTVVARSEQAARAISYVASTRARLHGAPVEFQSQTVPFDSPEPVAELAGRLAPDMVLNTASYQSPWEHLTSPSAWTALARAAGLGMTVPLQAAIARRVAQALAWAAPRSTFLNASFPDAVNPVLRCMGLPIFAGIGNVGLIAATLQGRLGLVDQETLQVLAHHWHLSTPEDGREARVWHDGRSVPGVTDLLREQRSTPRHFLNPATGHTAALLLRDLTRNTSFAANLPGPAGLPGGYPVQIEGFTISLRLPDQLSRDEAISWNLEFAAADGATVDGAGWVRFSPRVEEALLPHLPSLVPGFEVDALDAACGDLLALRDALRRQPVSMFHRKGGAV